MPRLSHARLLFASVAFLAGWTAQAQFKVTGPAPYTPAVARQRIKGLLDKVDSTNQKQTVDTLTGWLAWYRDIIDDELIAAWKKDTRANLPEVVQPLADARVAAAVLDFSWREQRPAAFLPVYAPMFEDMLLRFADSGKPMLDDLVRAAAAGQPLDLSPANAGTVCRILLDMPDIGAWRKTAFQILPFYRETAQLLLAADVRGFPGEQRDRAQFWLYDPRSPIRENQTATTAAPPFATRGQTAANSPPSSSQRAASQAQPPQLATNNSRPSLMTNPSGPPALSAPAAVAAAPPPYSGPRGGTLHCIGQPIQPNAEYSFQGLPNLFLRVEIDGKNWAGRVEAGEDQTQTLILRNTGPKAQKSCTVKWSVDR